MLIFIMNILLKIDTQAPPYCLMPFFSFELNMCATLLVVSYFSSLLRLSSTLVLDLFTITSVPASP